MKAASRGLSIPNAANPTPTLSTARVPAKFLHDRAMAPTGNLDRIHQSQEIVPNQHDLCALAGDLSTRSHGNTDRCLHQCRRIVDSIPDHGDLSAAPHEPSNDLALLIR